MEPNKTEEFYTRLKAQLEDTAIWPTAYLYKFILPTDENKIREIHTIFDNLGAVINSKQSKKGTYTSVSVNVTLPSADAVIEKYKAVGAIEGVISL